jgi:outer membrane protein assembly factor BamB
MLYSIDTNGSVNWVHPISGNGSWGGPCVSDDGRIFLGTDQGDLHCFNQDGTLAWNYHAGGGIWCCPAIGSGNSVYFSTSGRYLYALTGEGELEWRKAVGEYQYSSPSIGEDGTIYYGSHNSFVYAIWPNGTERWSYNTTGPIYRGLALGPDGSIYVQSGSKLRKIIDGELAWEVGNFTWGNNRAPTVDRDGNVITEWGVDTDRGIVFYIGAFSSNGDPLWEMRIGAGFDEPYSASITPDGKVLVTVEGKNLYVIGDDPSEDLWIQLGLEACVIAAAAVIIFLVWKRRKGDAND